MGYVIFVWILVYTHFDYDLNSWLNWMAVSHRKLRRSVRHTIIVLTSSVFMYNPELFDIGDILLKSIMYTLNIFIVKSVCKDYMWNRENSLTFTFQFYSVSITAKVHVKTCKFLHGCKANPNNITRKKSILVNEYLYFTTESDSKRANTHKQNTKTQNEHCKPKTISVWLK